MEMIISMVLLVVGFMMLVKGADWFVDGSSSLARRFGIPQLVIGLTIVAMGTSAPEAAVSIAAALKGPAMMWRARRDISGTVHYIFRDRHVHHRRRICHAFAYPEQGRDRTRMD